MANVVASSCNFRCNFPAQQPSTCRRLPPRAGAPGWSPLLQWWNSGRTHRSPNFQAIHHFTTALADFFRRLNRAFMWHFACVAPSCLWFEPDHRWNIRDVDPGSRLAPGNSHGGMAQLCRGRAVFVSVPRFPLPAPRPTHDKRSRPRGDHGAQLGDVDLGPTLNTPSTTAAF